MEAEHHDPYGEGAQRAMERLMALGVLVEAGSRLAAETARGKANRAEQDLADQARRETADRQAGQAARRARAKAERLASAERSRRARDWFRLAADGDRLRDYLAGLPFQEVARHWGQAAPYAGSNRTAATVLAAAEADLRRRAPGLMDLYRQQRDQGVPRQQAMANAAGYTWFGGAPARAHAGRPPTAGALTQVGEELDREITRLAGGLDPIGRARLLRNLEDNGWSAQSVAYVQTLLERAEAEHRTAEMMAGRPDDPATPVDEHQAAGPGAAAASGRGDDHTTQAAAVATAARAATPTQPDARASGPAQVAAQSFPVPARQAITAHPAAMPARIPAARRTRGRTR